MNFEDRYGTFDRLLYRIAFRVGTAQRALADVEEMFYGDALDDIEVGTPVFITALPRAGPTILLKLLWNTGHFATHTYQDTPFVLAPLLWGQYAESFARDIELTERAHGDGLEVSGESPEAFEEMVWKQFWPEHYQRDRIRPWTSEDQNDEFEAFFERHMRKVLAVREKEVPGAERCLSKNNLNVARLAAPPLPLHQGTFIVPFRHPVQQAASLKRQHERFLEIHEEDDFVREYMEAIGHHEFGKGLKPVDFDGWLDDAALPSKLTFWVQYWTAAYRFVLEHAGDNTVLLSYVRLTEVSLGRPTRNSADGPYGTDRPSPLSSDAFRRQITASGSSLPRGIGNLRPDKPLCLRLSGDSRGGRRTYSFHSTQLNGHVC